LLVAFGTDTFLRLHIHFSPRIEQACEVAQWPSCAVWRMQAGTSLSRTTSRARCSGVTEVSTSSFGDEIITWMAA
jgi:hypothetical protein